MGTRRADKAGSWYESAPRALEAEVDACMEKSAALFPLDDAEEATPVAVVVPHAGLAYSGAVAAAGFRRILERCPSVETFVVFGACHRSYLLKPALWGAGAWQTPLGDIEVDEELATLFVAAGVGIVNEGPHLGDNAIELQTPFIKHLFPGAKIVPIAVSSVPDAATFGGRAARAARKSGRNIMVLASTDLTHYGASFGIMPAGTGGPALAWLRENDGRFLDAVASLDGERIVAVAERDGSACGSGAVAAAAGWSVESGAKRARTLAYTNSYEVIPLGEAEHMVGYAAVAFEEYGEN